MYALEHKCGWADARQRLRLEFARPRLWSYGWNDLGCAEDED